MLQSEMRDVIAQGQQKVVVVVVLRTKKNSRLLHQIPVVFPDFRGSIERGGAVGGNVDFRGRTFAGGGKCYNLQIFAGQNGAIDQHGQRDRVEVDFAATFDLIRNMQRGAELPSRGQAQ